VHLVDAPEEDMARRDPAGPRVLASTPNAIEILRSISGTSEQVADHCEVAQVPTSYRQCVGRQTAVNGTSGPLDPGTGRHRPARRNPADPVHGFKPDAVNRVDGESAAATSSQPPPTDRSRLRRAP